MQRNRPFVPCLLIVVHFAHVGILVDVNSGQSGRLLTLTVPSSYEALRMSIANVH